MLFQTLSLASLALLASAAPVPQNAQVSGPGILLKNAGTLKTEFCFYNNLWNGDGTAGPNFDNAQQCVTLAGNGASQFVPLDPSFKGRVQRGQAQPATWAEFQIAASNDNAAHGDISIMQGSDGPATIASTDGTNVNAGFTKELVPIAPAAATTVRSSDGQTVLQTTMGNWEVSATDAGPVAAAAFANSMLDTSKVYISSNTGVIDIASSNQALAITFY